MAGVPKSPKCTASMWLGCFLRIAVRPRANESMLAEIALMATWLGPAASRIAWWLRPLREGEWGDTGAGDKHTEKEHSHTTEFYISLQF